MPIHSNTNINPYWDDFDPKKNFYRVLFKPGFPVQARELTQSQTIINDQVEKLASAFYRNGDTVQPGDFNLSVPSSYVRVSSITQGSKAKDFIGYTITGVISGVKAFINFAEEATDTEDVTFYVNYVDGGNSSEELTFVEGEVLESDTPDFFTATVGVKDTSKPIDTPPLGVGSLFTVNEGSYYANGFIVRNYKQTISLDKYGVAPTYEVGFVVDEDYIDVNDDTSLLDNAQGSSNFAAPGADRLRISLILTKKDQFSEIPNFISLANIVQGNIVGAPTQTVKWDWLYDILAKRTFDESGNYVVSDFSIKPMEYWDYAEINGVEYNPEGVFDPEPDKYGLLTPYPPVPGSGERNPLTYREADAKYALKVSPGSAYVQGYHVGIVNPFYIYGDKPRDLSFKPDAYTTVNSGLFLKVSNTYNMPDVVNSPGNTNLEAYKTITTYRNFTDGHVGAAFTATNLNENTSGLSEDADKTYNRPLNIGNSPWTTFHLICNYSIGDISVDKNSKKPTTIKIQKDNGSILTGIIIYPDPYSQYEPVEDPGNILSDPGGARMVAEGQPGSTETDYVVTDPPNGELSTGVQVQKSLVVCLVGPDGTPIDYNKVPNAQVVTRGDKIINSSSDTESTVLISKRIDPVMSGCIHPKYYYPDTNVNTTTDKGSFFSFNSTYNLGILSSTLFTEIIVMEDDTSIQEDWIVGEQIVGLQSGAVAKIEQVRNYDGNDTFLTISNIIGSFINGESIRQSTGAEDTTPIVDYLLSEKGEYFEREQEEGYCVLDYNNPFRSEYKTGTLLRNGEVIGFEFNDWIGSETSSPAWDGGGGDKDFFPGSISGDIGSVNRDIYTPEVNLVYNSQLRNLTNRLGPPGNPLETQKEANEWFYDKIVTKIITSDSVPVDPDKDDLWVNSNNYVLYVFDGNYWVGLTADWTTGDDSVISAAAVPVSTYDDEDDTTTPPTNTKDAYSLKNESEVLVYALGSIITLYRNDSALLPINPDGTFVEGDFKYNETNNSIELTKEGRDTLYNFAFFNPEQNREISRVNYEVVTTNRVRGYGIVLPSKITNTIKKTKSFFASLGTANDADFSADADLEKSDSADVYDIADSSLFSGQGGYNFITCDTFSGDASEELVGGDVISFTDDQGRVHYKLVEFATTPQGYGSRRTKCCVYLTTTLENDVTGKKISRIRIRSFGNSIDSSIYPLPVSVVHSLESNKVASGINYQVFRQFTETLVKGTKTLTLRIKPDNEAFISDPLRVTITVVKVESTDVDSEYDLAGRIIALDDTNPIKQIDGGGTMITYNLKSEVSETLYVKAIAPVQVTNSQAKKKVITRDFELVVPQATAKEKVVSLGVADGYRLKSVNMFNTEDDDYTEDITDQFLFDDGQRDTYYDLASIVRKSDSNIISADIKVVFDYFEHLTEDGNDQSDFFSVDSYRHESGVLYDEIPEYKPNSFSRTNATTDENAEVAIKLRDCIDFRPVANTAGDDPSVKPILDAQITSECINFKEYDVVDGSVVSGPNGYAPYMPIPSSSFECDIEYYLPKIDTLFVDNTGKMFITEGEPSPNPVAPPDIPTGIRLYDLLLPAYTFDVKDIVIRKHNYRRYTMKDIHDIDKRVNRVEKLVSLNALEIAALNKTVRDGKTGLDRFKNGIIVDPFVDHSRGDVGNQSYRAAIDPKESHLRAPFFKDQVKLEEKSQSDAERDILNYQNTNGIVTCKYESTPFIAQQFATTARDLQTFTNFTHEGVIHLSPGVDTFPDIYTPSEMVIERSDLQASSLNLTKGQKEGAMGTVWSNWETSGRLPSAKTNQLGGESSSKNLSNTELINNFYASGTIAVADTTYSVTKARDNTQTQGVDTGMVVATSYGDRIIDFQMSDTMRTISVNVFAQRLKPHTRYYAYFDDINVSDWFSIDKVNDKFVDGIHRFDGAPNSNPAGFGTPIVTDGIGNLTGVFLIPNGRPPVTGTVFTGDLNDIEYQTSGPTRSFKTGQVSFKLTSDPVSQSDPTDIDGYAVTDFISRAVIEDNQNTIVSTRQPEYTTTVSIQEDARTKTDSGLPPSPIPASFDPLAQTFKVDRNSPEGVFVTELDIFFQQKDRIQGVEAYIVDVNGDTPSNRILPHSRVVKSSDSIIRVRCDLASGVLSTSLPQGTIVLGQTSGATGRIKTEIKFSSSQVVYDVVLDDYVNDFVKGEVIVPQINPSKNSTFTIVEDEVTITRVDITNMGQGYFDGSVEVEFEAPDLPGGERATGVAKVADKSIRMNSDYALKGEVYEIVLTSSGSGYTKVPGVTVKGNGTTCRAVARVVEGRKAVDMGVATSDDAKAPTKFRFAAPVYLLGNTTYAFVVKSPASVSYKLWVCKGGENTVGSNGRATNQFTIGSMFTSQNNGIWSEDQNTDVTFRLHRAEFSNTMGDLILNNSPFTSRKLSNNPIETNSTVGGGTRFGSNPSVIRVNHQNHGLSKFDKVAISGVIGEVGGIPSTNINSLHTVIDVTLHTFTVMLDDVSATKDQKAGGSEVFCTYNRPYETVNLYAGAMTFPSTSIVARNRTVLFEGQPVFSYNFDTPDTSAGYNKQNAYTIDSEEEDIPLMDSYYYSNSKLVASMANEANYRDDQHLRGEKSLRTRISLSTANSKVSPVIDLDRTNLNVIRNLIDNPSKYDPGTGSNTTTVSVSTNLRAAGVVAGDEIEYVNKQGNFATMLVADVDNSANTITLEGSQLLQKDDVQRFVSAGLANSTVNKVEVSPTPDFNDESYADGTIFAKYITKVFSFENECDGIEVKLNSCIYDKTSIRVYYKLRTVGFDGDFNTVSWTPFNPNGVAPGEVRTENGSLVRTPGLPGNIDDLKPRTSFNTDPKSILPSDWQELSWSVQDLSLFDAVAIKIVMVSNNPAQAPLIDDLQMIVSE